jgi:hypothetical protein
MIAHNDRTRLVEVALPLEAINKVSVRETSIYHGQPCTRRLWWVLPSDFGVTSANYTCADLFAWAGEPS